MKVIIQLDKDNNFKIMQLGEVGKQTAKALEKADENTKMFCTADSERYLLKKDKENEKIIPTSTFQNDVDELSSKKLINRYQEKLKDYKKMKESEEK